MSLDRQPEPPRPSDRADYPSVPIIALDTLWIQVSGTVCNLSCTHCFISCSPGNHSHDLMPLSQVLPYLDEAEALGVKEYYFTGGEPFINPAMEAILAEALRRGPCTVLTNGLLIGARRAAALKALSDASAYSLDIRISLDGVDAAANDPIRGKGTFDRILEATGHLAAAGLDPVLTVTEACEEAVTAEGRTRLLGLMRGMGLARPRLKVMPLLRLGAETRRTRPYAEEESLRGWELDGKDIQALVCSSSRMVTSKGVYVCPILIDSGEARLGSTVAESLRPFSLAHRACHTCHAMGLSCRT
jgi:molybdenum cofactor biosynthesis enzyme MoaA